MTIDNITQLRAWRPPYRPNPIIEDGILLPETTMMLFAAAGSWKTMTSTHLACCIATGTSWFGFQTLPATVLSIQVEMPKLLMKDRTMKYIDGPAQVKTSNLWFQTPSDDVLIDTTFGALALEKSIEEVLKRRVDDKLPLVLMLDPLYLLMAGHISDEYDAKKFQRNLNAFRRKYHITTIIIHHSRLSKADNEGKIIDLGAEELMGSSYWNNWFDTIMRLKVQNPFSGSDVIKYDFSKTRNAQAFLPSFVVQWDRHTLIPYVVQRDIVEAEDPSIRDLL